MAIMNVTLEKIEANLWNPNQMDPAIYENLKTQMIVDGDLGIDPLIVTPKNVYTSDPDQPNDIYVLVDGEHRWKAALELGWQDIRCDVWNLNEGEAKSVSYKRNKLRGSMDPYREAELFKSMHAELKTQEAVAAFFGVDRTLVAKRLAILKTSDGVKEVFESVPRGTLSVSHIEALSSIKDVGSRKELTQQIVDYDLTVREIEEKVKRINQDLEQKAELRRHVEAEASVFKVCPECGVAPRRESWHGYPWVSCSTGGCSIHAWNLETGETYPPKEKPSDLTEEEREARTEAAKEGSKPKSFRYPVTKDEIRSRLAKLIIAEVTGFVDLDRVNITGVNAEGTEIRFELSSDDGVTMSFYKNLYNPRPDPGDEEDEHDFYDMGRWSRKNEEQSIYFNVEPKEWKRDKKNKVKVNVGDSDPEKLQKVRDFLDGL